METRADFYIRDDEGLRWQGSVTHDGYDVEEPKAWAGDDEETCRRIQDARAEQEFVEALDAYFKMHDRIGEGWGWYRRPKAGWSRRPKDGWPWAHSDSTTTDRAYVLDLTLDEPRVRMFRMGDEIAPPLDFDWPDMSAEANVTDGGFMLLGVPS